MTEPYVEITCSDCGVTYEPIDGDCPACGSGNCSYDGALMAEHQRWVDDGSEYEQDREVPRRKTWWPREP